MECMDGVFVFDWEKLGPTQRNRIMYLKKFRGLLTGMEQEISLILRHRSHLKKVLKFEHKTNTGKIMGIINIGIPDLMRCF